MTAERVDGGFPPELETVVAPFAAEIEVGLRERARRLCSACRQIFGIPDYERYLAHAARRHPGAPVLPRGDFFVHAIERKYGKGGARCC